MKISVIWLKEFLDTDISASDLIDRLNSIGLLVDFWEEKEGDVVLDLETYANRPDTLGHLGVARDLAAVLGTPLIEQPWPLIEADEEISDRFNIQIWDEDLCPRYCGVIVEGLEVKSSPAWLQKRIRMMGLNPINNVVDVTNYVLYATAQPIHAFDLSRLQGNTIIVRRAKRGETLRSLEGDDLLLTSEMLVIADEKEPVALAGIIGGEASGVTEATRDVLIESAYFDPVSIRATWKKTGVQTDASYRFERGADISFPPRAAQMAASLLTQMGGRALKGILDIYPKKRRPKTVVLRHHRIAELLGVNVSEDFVQETLPRLDLQLEPQQKGIWQVKVPTFRVDIEREADLIEEIARFYGYDNVPAQLPVLSAVEPRKDTADASRKILRQALFHAGFDEVVNYSFTSPHNADLFKTERRAVQIRNPISSRGSQLRLSLLPGLLENVVYNLNRGAEGVHIFETGNIFAWQEDSVAEQLSLAMVTTGALGGSHWQEQQANTDFYHIKGACEAFLGAMGFGSAIFAAQDHPHYQPDLSLGISVKGNQVGAVGLIKPEILKSFDLKNDVWAAEIDLEALFALKPPALTYKPVVKFPSIRRDISFYVDRGVSFQEIRDTIAKLAVPHLEDFGLYDRYTGKGVPKGKVSLSLRFTFRHPQKTLLAEEVDDIQEKIMQALLEGFDLHFREGGAN